MIGHASVLYADGKLILLNDTGELILARANPQQYEELARVRVLGGEICWTQPTLFRGRLFVRNHSRAACLVLSRSGRSGIDDTALLTVADIPQTAYRDWAAIVLTVEPEYAMDLPPTKQLRLWFFVTLATWAAAAALAAIAVSLGSAVGRIANRHRPPKSNPNHGDILAGGVPSGKDPTADEQRLPGSAFRRLHFALALLCGALGTTLLSAWSQHFLFTWPLCLFVTFQAVVYTAQPSRKSTQQNRWRSRLVMGAFLSLPVAYFFICRRLSLAVEWTFLTGFAAAVPFLLLARWKPLHLPFRTLGELACVAVAYCASVGVLLWKY